MSDLITRNFTVKRHNRLGKALDPNYPVRELNYPFTTFSSIFANTKCGDDNVDRLVVFLREVFLEGVPEISDAASISEMSRLLVEVEEQKSELPELAARANYEGMKFRQHAIVQEYFLRHDPHTIATEVPLWCEKEKISGHIDLVRVVRPFIQVCDFKPLAHKEKKAASQVSRYIKQLAKQTTIPLKFFEGVYFDNRRAYFLK